MTTRRRQASQKKERCFIAPKSISHASANALGINCLAKARVRSRTLLVESGQHWGAVLFGSSAFPSWIQRLTRATRFGEAGALEMSGNRRLRQRWLPEEITHVRGEKQSVP